MRQPPDRERGTSEILVKREVPGSISLPRSADPPGASDPSPVCRRLHYRYPASERLRPLSPLRLFQRLNLSLAELPDQNICETFVLVGHFLGWARDIQIILDGFGGQDYSDYHIQNRVRTSLREPDPSNKERKLPRKRPGQ